MAVNVLAKSSLVVLFAGSLLATLVAQQPKPTFEVASIKENKNLADGGSMRFMPGGGITAQHMAGRNFIAVAFQLQQFQLVDAPGWLSETFYDVQAKPADTATREQTYLMMQALLRERFRLTFHREQRDVTGYSLMVARAGQLGPNLTHSAIDCQTMFATTPRCREGGIKPNSMKSFGAPLYQVVSVLVNQVHAPVSDDTHLTGPFDIELTWSTDVAPTDDARSIFAALQEQLGLKLERTRVSTELFVIDHVEKPTPD